MFFVKKINGKLIIVDENNNLVYSKPNFLLISSRQDLQLLADKFNEVGYRDIDAILEWESKLRPTSPIG